MASDQFQSGRSLLTIVNHYIIQNLESIRNDEEFKDLTIVCNDGAALRAHKMIVAKYSSVLKEMISSKRKAAAVRINLNDVDSEQKWEPWMMEIILDFMYGKEIKLTAADLKPVIKAAVKLNIPEFLLACQGIMSTNETEQNEDIGKESPAISNTVTQKYIKVEPVTEVTEIPLTSSITNQSKRTLDQQHGDNLLKDESVSHNNKAVDSESLEDEAVDNKDDISNDENETDDGSNITIEEPQRKIMRTSSSEKCSLCGDVTGSKAKLADHLLEAHNLSACPICMKMFENQIYLDKHKETHLKPERTSGKHAMKERKRAYNNSTSKRVTDLSEKECEAQLTSFDELAKHLNEAHELIACNFCTKVFDSVGHLGRHRILHTEKILVADQSGLFIYSCHICQDINDKLREDQVNCNPTFMNVSEFYKHQDKEHGGLKCRICKAKKAKLIRLCDHMLTSHIEENLFDCDDCDRHFPTLESLRKHQFNHKKGYIKAKPTESICEHCGRCFKSLRGMEVHIEQKHTPVKDFKCSECTKSFSTEKFYQVHMKKCHGERKFICDECGNSFLSFGNLNTHISKVHNPEGLMTKCEHCGTDFKKNVLRLRHIRRTPECRKALNMYTIQCGICEKKFCRQVDLDMHMDKIHSGVDFECDECGRTYQTQVKLNKHKREHLRLYQCAVCSKRFGDRKHLKEHERIHTGVKPYKCIDCGKAFTQSGSLYKHKQTHSHKVGVERNQISDNTTLPVDNNLNGPDVRDEINIIIPAQNNDRAEPQFIEFVQLLCDTNRFEIKK